MLVGDFHTATLATFLATIKQNVGPFTVVIFSGGKRVKDLQIVANCGRGVTYRDSDTRNAKCVAQAKAKDQVYGSCGELSYVSLK